MASTPRQPHRAAHPRNQPCRSAAPNHPESQPRRLFWKFKCGTHKDDHGGGEIDGRREAGAEEGHEYHLPRRNDLIFLRKLCLPIILSRSIQTGRCFTPCV
nr:uncharacterized protein LOC109768402 isoform X2 [Aegilops tauschii subsp. strangulata]